MGVGGAGGGAKRWMRLSMKETEFKEEEFLGRPISLSVGKVSRMRGGRRRVLGDGDLCSISVESRTVAPCASRFTSAFA